MGVFVDLVLVLLVLLIIYMAYRKGFLRSILSLGGFLIATVFAFVFGRMFAEGIFEWFVKPWLTTTVQNDIVAGTGNNITQVVENMYTNLPGILSGGLDMLFGSKQALITNIQNGVAGGSVPITDTIVGTLKPLLVSLISILAIFILFALCMLALRVINRLLVKVRHIPVIGAVDGLLGGLIGILEAAIWVMILVFLVKALILLSGNGLPWLNENIIDSSYMFKYLYHFDITKAFSGLTI